MRGETSLEKEQYIEEMEIDLREILHIIRKRIWILITIPLIGIIISAVVSFFVLTPIYEASTTLIVGRQTFQDPDSEIQYSNLRAYQQLVKTYGEIAKSRSISREVIEKLNLEMTPEQLQNSLKVTTVGDTELMKISVENPSPEMAKNIANTLASVFSERIIEIKKVDTVSVIDPAITPQNPIKPKKKLNIAIAAVLGVMIALGIIFLLEYLDNTVKTIADVEKYLELPTLGTIPKITEEDMTVK